MNGRIYIHKNKINGKCYVGQTTQKPKHRWGINGVKYKDSPKFYRAIEKYGWNNFDHIVLPTIYHTQDELNQAEIEIIQDMDSIKNGYNISLGGQIGVKNQEYIDSVSKEISQYDMNGNLIKTWLSGKEIKRVLDVCDSTIRRAVKSDNKSAYGYIWKYGHSNYVEPYKHTHSKNVIQYDLDKNHIETYDSVKEASMKTNTHKDAISNVCRGKAKTANGFYWSYVWA